MQPTYIYRATLIRVIDGDSMLVEVDLGFHVARQTPVRLCGINAPELRTIEGKLAKAHLYELLKGRYQQPLGHDLMIRSHKGRSSDKYGRWLAEVYLPGSLQSVNDQMVRDGRAVVA